MRILLGLGVLAMGAFAACSSSEDEAAPGVDAGADTGPGTSEEAGAPDANADGGTADPNLAHAFTSGTRLRAIWLEAEGGVKQLLGFRDTQLDTDCMFHSAEDGSFRCVPSAIPFHHTGLAGFTENPPYLEGACNQPFTYAPSCPASFATGLSTADSGACIVTTYSRLAVRSVGAVIDAGPDTPYFQNIDDAGCAEAGTTSGALQPVGQLVAPSMFVGAHYETAAAIGQVAPRFIVADDGTRAFDGFVDTTSNEPCRFDIAPDGQVRCLPTSVLAAQFPGQFADDKCTRAAAGGYTGCTPPAYASLTSTAVCTKLLRFAKIGAPITTYYVLGPDGPTDCRPVAAPDGNIFDTTDVPITTFFAATSTAHVGGARLKEVVASLPGGASVTISLFDEGRMEPCAFGGKFETVASDGVVHCLPKAEYYHPDQQSSDSTCDAGAGVAIGNRCADGGAYAYALDTACPNQQRIYEVVEPDTPLTQVWHPEGDTCTGPTTAAALARATKRPLDPSTFVKGDVIVAP